MKVEVQLLSTLRDCLPESKGEGEIDLSDDSTLVDLMVHLGIDKKLGKTPKKIIESASWVIMINGHFEHNLERTLNEGDKIQIFPWVAGG